MNTRKLLKTLTVGAALVATSATYAAEKPNILGRVTQTGPELSLVWKD